MKLRYILHNYWHRKWFFVVCLLSVGLIAYEYLIWDNADMFRKPIGEFARDINETSAPGVILLWMPFFGDYKWNLPSLGRTPFIEHQCPHNNCIMTSDRRYAAVANLVLFHCVDRFYRWPNVRDPRQIYAAYCWEAPTHYNFQPFGDKINMTVTYRLDSDITDFAGRLKVRDTPGSGRYIPRIKLSDKIGDIVWPVSHCTTLSEREKYVRRLERSINVDVIGKCGNRSCPRSQTGDCLKQFEQKYKFYLAFENNVCVDYVSEKFFRPLGYELIPIVLGGGQYKRIAPPGSYINVDDFRSPEDLAKYLKYLAANETAYYEYFQWKQTHVMDTPYLWCQICQVVMEGKFHKPSRNIDTWWTEEPCQNDLVARLLS